MRTIAKALIIGCIFIGAFILDINMAHGAEPSKKRANVMVSTQGYDLSEPFLSPEKTEKARKGFYRSMKMFFFDMFYKILVLFVLIVSGAGKAIHSLAKRITGRYWVQLPLFIVLFVLAYIVLRIPYDIGRIAIHARTFGVPLVAGDIVAQIKSGLFSWLMLSVAFIAAMFPLFGLIRRKPKSWWIIATLIAAALVFLEINIEQMVLSSMQNKSTLMADSPTRRKLEVILKKALKDISSVIPNKILTTA